MSENVFVRVGARRALVLALAAGVLSGCAVDEHKEVATYRQQLDPPGQARLDAPAKDELLTLDKALLLANQNDEQLSIKGESYLQSLIARARAAAGFLPNISASAGHTLAGEGFTAHNSTSVGASGSMTVFNLRTMANIEQATTNAEQQRRLLLELQQAVLIGVAENFYSVLKSERSVVVLRNTLTFQTERVRDMQERSRLGMNRPLDLAQAQADESSTQVLLLQALSNVRNARTTLAFLVGLPSLDNPLDDRFVPTAEQPTPEEFEKAALEHREDYAAAKLGVESAEIGVKGAWREYYPTANINASYLIWSNPGVGNPWSLGISLFEPIFNAGLIHQDVREAMSSLRQSVLELQRLQRLIHEDVVLAYEDFITSTAKIKQLDISVNAAQRAYDLAVAQYKLGNATNLDQLTAQDRLLQSQLQLATERYSQKVFYLSLLRVTGQFKLGTPAQLPTQAAPAPAAVPGP